MRPSQVTDMLSVASSSDTDSESPEEKRAAAALPITQQPRAAQRQSIAVAHTEDRSPSLFTPSSSDDEDTSPAAAAAASNRRPEAQWSAPPQTLNRRRSSGEDEKRKKDNMSPTAGRSAVRIMEVPQVKSITPRVSMDSSEDAPRKRHPVAAPTAQKKYQPPPPAQQPAPPPPTQRSQPPTQRPPPPAPTQRPPPPAPTQPPASSPSRQRASQDSKASQDTKASPGSHPVAAVVAAPKTAPPPSQRKDSQDSKTSQISKASQDTHPEAAVMAAPKSAPSLSRRKDSQVSKTSQISKVSEETHPEVEVVAAPESAPEKAGRSRSRHLSIKKFSQTKINSGDKADQRAKSKSASTIDEAGGSKAIHAERTPLTEKEDSPIPYQREREDSWFGFPREENELPAAISIALRDSDTAPSSAGEISAVSSRLQSSPSTPRAFRGDRPAVAAAHARASWQAARDESRRLSQELEKLTPQASAKDMHQTKVDATPSRQLPVGRRASVASGGHGGQPGTTWGVTLATPTREMQQKTSAPTPTGQMLQRPNVTTPKGETLLKPMATTPTEQAQRGPSSVGLTGQMQYKLAVTTPSGETMRRASIVTPTGEMQRRPSFAPQTGEMLRRPSFAPTTGEMLRRPSFAPPTGETMRRPSSATMTGQTLRRQSSSSFTGQMMHKPSAAAQGVTRGFTADLGMQNRPTGNIAQGRRQSIQATPNFGSRRASIVPQGSGMTDGGGRTNTGRSQPPAKPPGSQTMEAAAQKVTSNLMQTLESAGNRDSYSRDRGAGNEPIGGGNVKGLGPNEEKEEPLKPPGPRPSPDGGGL